MNETTHKTEPLNIDNPIIVLNDGETFTALEGVMIAFPPADMETDDIEGILKDNGFDDYTFGSTGQNWELEDICKMLQVMLPDYKIHIRTGQDTIRIQKK